MAPPGEHTAPDDLALLALGEHPDGVDESHLAGCSQCQSEVDQLRAVVTSARAVTAEDAPQAPAAHVWDAVAAELGLGTAVRAEAVGAGTAPQQLPSQWRRRTALLAAAAAVAGLVAGSVVTGLVVASRDGNGGGVVATARLAALPAHQGRGAAEVVGSGSSRVLRLDVSGLTTGNGFYEVWLLGADGKRLVSLGLLDGSTASFALPGDVDLTQYPVVDVSLEPVDGDPAHSGDSIVRGTLNG